MAHKVNLVKAEVYIADTVENLDIEGQHNTLVPYLPARYMAATLLYLQALGLNSAEVERIMDLSAEIIRGK